MTLRDDGDRSVAEPPSSPGPAPPSSDLGLVGKAIVMQNLRAEIRLHAKHSHPILITGETGSGKELVARALHFESHRAREPFVAVNMASLDRGVQGSELFGHVRGAFTGADRTRSGLLLEAERGTIFFDEFAELDLQAQAALLRALEAREVRPVGGDRAKPFHARVVAATHSSLSRLVQDGRFRLDLYHRVVVVRIHVPPLRARVDDLPLLVRHLLGTRQDKGHLRVTGAALDRLRGHPWPGNIRELANVLIRASLLTQGDLITEATVTAALTEPEEEPLGLPPRPRPEATELENLLQTRGGSISAAARHYGVSRTTIRRWRRCPRV